MRMSIWAPGRRGLCSPPDRFARAVVLLAALASVVAVGCRSKSEYGNSSGAGGGRGRHVRFGPAPPESNLDDVSSADADLYAGTPQNLILSGSVTGKIVDAGRGKRRMAGCVKVPNRSFLINLLGPLDGKAPYRIELGILSDYKGPRTYELSKTIQVGSGVVAYFKNTQDKGAGLIGYAGSVTVNADERGGSIDADLRGGFGRPERVHVQGTWNCPPDRS